MILRLISLLCALVAVAGPAAADIVVNVDQGATQPLPIAVPAFGGAASGARISQVISADLQRSELFRPLEPASFREQIGDVNVQPNFDKWKEISAQALLVGQVVGDSEGRLRVNFRLWDVYAGEQLLGVQFTSTPENWRRVAHKVADAVYEKLTGAPGYFDTRVAFVAESGTKAHPVRRLEIMDQDGANPSFLTDGSSLAFTPRFSANSQEVTYMALRPSGSSVYLLNIETGRQEALGHFPGMVFAPRFSPDGSRVIFSVERAGNTDIYVMDLASRATRRLTSDPSIDTSPSFSPDGTQLVFNSDRGGSPQLYVMGADGGGTRRISFGTGRYTTPVWSPDGKWIAFTKQDGAGFHIGVMKADGGSEKILTSSYLDEGPTWAPNSRVLMYAHQGGGAGARLYMVDISGRAPQAAPYPLGASDPAWSALLP
ncbi:MAG TPA: Tol-Pal system beta propeller repeat protein TolB [Caulobacteraceae bacterium]|nr:Tol-Pal system beta propeller repeat protein TolB [Caulobacteraceae bacterium]